MTSLLRQDAAAFDAERAKHGKDARPSLRAVDLAPDVVAREARSRAFMESLMGTMSQDPTSPHRRIVFNACLTASNEIAPGAIDPAGTPDAQAAQMRAVLASSPSLTSAMRGMAPAAGPGVDVRGGNGSFGQVGLIDGTGALDIVADGADPDGDGDSRTLDPELTNPDKLVYVEEGTDPDGCMSAVTERWAIDRTTLMPAIQPNTPTRSAITLLLLCSFSCRRSPEMPPQSSKPADSATDTPPATPDASLKPDGTNALPPKVDLGAELTAVAFSPGRFATVVQEDHNGRHALNKFRQTSTASLVLELGGDGTATACRGLRYADFNDGPKVHTQTDYLEQLGYRGTYQLQDGFVDVSLAQDDSVCAARREYGSLARVFATSLQLHCVMATPRQHPSLVSPVLLCQWIRDGNSRVNLSAFLVPGIVEGEWIILGSGNGLQITATGRPAGYKVGPEPTLTVEEAPILVGVDAWDKPL